MTVERKLSIAELESETLRLTPAEAKRLGIPEFSQSITVRFEGQESLAHWDVSKRTISGEQLFEDLLLEAGSGDLIRWTNESDVFVLELLGAWTAGTISGRGSFTSSPFADDPFGDVAPTRHVTISPAIPKKRTRVAQPVKAYVEADFDWPQEGIGILKESILELSEAVVAAGWDSPDSYRLRLNGEKLSTINGFDELVAADSAAIEPMAHQYATARKALGLMRGRAILADEVGLGKTVEAGLIASELAMRRLASRVLVICPAPLRQQWHDELKTKFNLETEVVLTGKQKLPVGSVIMSSQLARIRQDVLHKQDWDLVVVDEAHRFSGANAQKSQSLIRGSRAATCSFSPLLRSRTTYGSCIGS